MTENKISKLNGKRVRFKMHVFPYSVQINEYEGKLEITYDVLYTNRNGKMIQTSHVGFYLYNDKDGKLKYFDYRCIKLITELEVIE